MGGSAIVGDLLLGYLKLESSLPVIVNRDSHLPAFVDRQTLVFLITYSGNTMETLHNYHDALTRKAKLVAVTSGGKMQREAMAKGIPWVKVQADGLPRLVWDYCFFQS